MVSDFSSCGSFLYIERKRCLFFEMFLWKTRCACTRVNELIAGAKPSNCQISGDPKNLEASLHDLHPASWYALFSWNVHLYLVSKTFAGVGWGGGWGGLVLKTGLS